MRYHHFYVIGKSSEKKGIPLYVKGKTHGRPDEGPPVVMHDGFLEIDANISKGKYQNIKKLNYAGWDEAEEQEGPVVSQSPHLCRHIICDMNHKHLLLNGFYLFVMTLPLKSTMVAHQGVGES